MGWAQTEEKYYACTWLPAPGADAASLLLFAGEMGIIHVADPTRYAITTVRACGLGWVEGLG